jgi:hypothetical protein
MSSASNVSITNDFPPQSAKTVRKSRFIEHMDDEREISLPIRDHEPDVDILQRTSNRSKNDHVTSIAMYQGSMEEASLISSEFPETVEP